MIFIDFETCGFHGMPVLLQFAINDGEIVLYELWRNKIKETLELFELITNHKDGIVGFNLTFDWFHFNKFYNTLKLVVARHPEALEWYPDEHVEEIAYCEKDARDGVCVKPVKACDLFLHARKGVYQSTLDRKDIRIKRVPKVLARPLAEELNKRIKFNKLYFARRKEQLENPWQVFDIRDGDNDIEPDFKDIVLKFSPSSGLKALAVDALGADESDLLQFGDVSVHQKLNPIEVGWAPFAEAIGSPGQWNRSWPDVIKYHIEHWCYHEKGREYARRDIVYTRGLYEFFGRPELDDDDSVLACAVAAIRWKGYAVDIEGIKKLKDKALELSETAPKSPGRVKDWIWPDLDETEKLATGNSTKKVVLEEMATWKKECEHCEATGRCADETLCMHCTNGCNEHPAATKAKMVLDARKAKKEIEIYDKLLLAGRFHASFKIIGALSGRMSGGDGLNAQGIKSTKEVRRCFPLAFDCEELCGGDFESFEVVIAVAIYKDPKLEADLNTLSVCPGCLGAKTKKGKDCSDCVGTGSCKKKIHGLFGEALFDKCYEDIVATKGSAKDLYTDGKRGVFASLYGGNENTLVDRLGVTIETAKSAFEKWTSRYPGIKKAQQRIVNMFATMKQPDGLGHKIYWADPAQFMPSLLGFRRYFDLENRISKVLFDLAEKPPKEWTNLRITVRRRDRDQTVSGAVRSALFGSAFQIQSANIRAATNHEIQSTGAGITKHVQRRLWDLQPNGIHPWVVRPMNIHDEIMCPCNHETKLKITTLVKEEVEKFRPLIPMIGIDWSEEMKTWADK